MSDDIFVQTTDAEGNVDNPLTSLVGSGKKFATAEELARGKLEADKHISQLEGELKLMREEMAKIEGQKVKEHTITDLMDAIKNANKQADPEGNHPISEEDLRKTVSEIMEGRLEEQTRLENRARANKAVLDKVNGDVEAAKSYVAERAKELIMSVEDLQSLSERSPSAFLKLIGSEPKPGSPGVSSLHGANTATIEGSSPQMEIDGHRTKAYYSKLKEELGPQKYWMDTKIQSQYMKDSIALGDRFNQ